MDSGRLGDYDLLLFSQLLPTPGASGDLGFKLINHHLSGISEFRIVRTCVRWLPLTPSLPPSLPPSLLTSSYPPSLPLLPMPGCGLIIVCVLIHECSEEIPSSMPCGSPPSAPPPPPPPPRGPILPPLGAANPIPFLRPSCSRHYKVGWILVSDNKICRKKIFTTNVVLK